MGIERGRSGQPGVEEGEIFGAAVAAVQPLIEAAPSDVGKAHVVGAFKQGE